MEKGLLQNLLIGLLLAVVLVQALEVNGLATQAAGGQTASLAPVPGAGLLQSQPQAPAAANPAQQGGLGGLPSQVGGC